MIRRAGPVLSVAVVATLLLVRPVNAAPRGYVASSEISGKSTEKRSARDLQGRTVREIRFEGLRRTRARRLRQLLDTRVGRPFDAATWQDDLRRLRNQELFQGLRARLRAVGPDGMDITLRMRDKWSLLPYFNAFFNLSSVNVITGVYDPSVLGNLFYLDLQLLLFSYLPMSAASIRPGGIVAVEVPRLAGRRLTWGLTVRAQTTVSTVWADRAAVSGFLQLEYYGGYHFLEWEPASWLRVGLRQTVFRADYREAGDAAPPTSAPIPAGGWTHELTGLLSLGHLSYESYLYHGLRVDLAVTGAPGALGTTHPFLRLEGLARGFWNLGRRGGNLAVRVGAGYQKGGGYADLFRVGSFTGLRGFVTNQFVGRAYVFGNLEYRTGLLAHEFPIVAVIPYFKGKTLRLQGAAFVDLGAVAGGGPYRTRESGQLLAAVGVGLRVAVVNIYKAVLRLDLAYAVAPYRSIDFIVATQQYF